MNKRMQKLIAVFSLVLLLASMIVVPNEVQAASEFYGDYTDVAKIADYNSCPSLQGIAVGSQMIYSIKINTNNANAFISMTDKDSGETTKLYNQDAGSYMFSYLNHANDMDVWGIDGKSHLFIATTLQGANAIVHLKRDGNNLTKIGTYHLKCDGEDICATALAIKGVSNGQITFISKWGMDLYTGSVSTSATNATINMTKICTISKDKVYIKGEYLDLSTFVNQGMGYHNGVLYVPITGDDNWLERSVVMVFNLDGVIAGSTIRPSEAIVFRVTSGAYSALFEIESCDISSGDNKLYFGVQRRKSSTDTNHDGIAYFNDYTFVKLTEPAKYKNFKVQYNANGGSGTMEASTIPYGVNTQLRANAFTKNGCKFTGWTAYRTTQNQWYYTNGTTSSWYAEGSQPDGYSLYIYKDAVKVAKTSSVDGDVVQMYAQWGPSTYTVRYDPNGGTGTMDDTLVTYGTNTNLAANAFTRPGYTFAGWHAYRTTQNQWYYTDGTNSGWYAEGAQPEGYTKSVYRDQVGVAKTTGVDNDLVIMYAQWEANGYTVTFKDEDGTVLKTDVLEAGSIPAAPADPSKVSNGVYSYTFNGWSPAIEAVAGDVTYTATYTVTLIPPTIEPITPVAGMLAPYLERVESAEDLEEGVPYVISDYKDSWLHYVLTAEKAEKVANNLTHKGLLLNGTPSVDETNLWYIKDGNLVYGSADSDHYLLISCDSNYQGTVELGSYDASKAAYLSYISSDNFIVRSTNGYLNRHGGGSDDFIATAYYAVGGSYWHLDRLVRGKIAAITLSASDSTVLAGSSIQLTPAVTVDGIATNGYTISWSVDNNSIATVSSNGMVTALKCGQATVTATLTAVDGHELLIPTTATYTITVSHDYKASVTKPTCTAGGYTVHRCTTCGDTYTTDQVAALGHSYEASVTAPTCTEAGYTTYTCHCGSSYVADRVVALGHKYQGVVTTAPGCDSAGVKTYTCGNCGDVYTEILAATGHHYEKVVTAPTCTEKGYTTYTCLCGHSYHANETAALGHSYKTVTVNATCTKNGSITDTCTTCGDTQVEVIPATGHSYEAVITAPTCTEAGYTTYTCHCGDSYIADEVAALGHTYETVTVDATCTVDGSITNTCHCGDTQVEIIPATGHSYEAVVTAPTCTEAGYTTYTCHCGDSYTADEVAALGHTYETVTIDPTCTVDGSITNTCHCGDTQVEVIPATGHSYEAVVTAPTCTEAGYTTYTCHCGDSYNADEIAALGHKYQAVITTVPSCDSAGVKTFTCENCGDTYTEPLAATGHNYTAVVTAPTCTEAGYTTYNCPCGHSYIANDVPALGHSYETVTIDPTCTADGSITYTCHCGDTQVETIPATGHSYEAVITAPTCTEAGYTTYTCHCGDSYTADEVAALGHSYETVTVDATCTVDGSITNTCYCGDTQVEVIPATGHSYEAVITAPTCTEAGYTTYTCHCGDSYTADEVAALGHSYETVTVDATCTVDGSITTTCTNCGDTQVEVIPATGHSYEAVITAPTCTEAGYTTYTCHCGDSYTADEVAALGHSYETVTVDATCTVDGSITNTCYCGDTQVEVIPATGHSYEAVITAPTCTEAGYTTYTCHCGDSYIADEVAALGHTYETVTVDATCTVDGSITTTCTNCGDTQVEVIPATGHSYEAVITAPTCTEAGYTTYTCHCGDSYTADEVAALGHSYETVTVDATCTVDGSITNTCYCGDTQVEVIPATGHSYEAVITAPTCTEAGYTTYTCHCGDSYIADEVAALGHTYETVTIDPTCTADGSITNTCHCGDTQVEVIPATGHSFVDGICGACGEADPDYVKPVTQPTLKLKAPALEFKDMIKVIAFFTAENLDSVVEMGMITYTENVEVVDITTAAHVIPGAEYDAGTGRYYSSSQGIHAKYLGDDVYLAIYAKLSDGSYVYTRLVSYSPITYASNQLKNSTDLNLKQLVAAMLNYGAAAQNYFGYKTDALANAAMTEEQINLPEAYRADMVNTVASPSKDKQGIFANNKGFGTRRPAVSFEGAFSINYFFTPNYTPVDGITMYYWTEAAFNAVDVLTVENASGSVQMSGEGVGQYRGDIEGIAAKSLSEAVYVAAVYSDGTTSWTSGVLGYSIGAYCSSQATKGGTMADLAMATAVYGYHAKAYFG